MKTYSLLLKLVIFSSLLMSRVAFAAVDTVRHDVQTGDWIFTLNQPETNQQKIWRYVPRNQFKPIVTDSFQWAGKNQFLYSYDLRNDTKSKQSIAFMWVSQARMEIKGLPAKVPLYEGEDTVLFKAWRAKKDIAYDQKKKVIQSIIKPPADWSGDIDIDSDTSIGHNFGWFSSIENTASDLAPSKTLRGAGLSRPELPGVGIMKMLGETKERGRPADFPDSGPLSDKLDELLDNDPVRVPVIVPAITVPIPYNGAELAKNLKQEISSWTDLGVAKQDAIDRLNRQFDVLIPALQGNNKATVRAAAYEIFKELFSHHHHLSHRHFDTDHHDHETKPIDYKRKATAHSQTSTEAPLHRVAARALGINMMYLLTRSEMMP